MTDTKLLQPFVVFTVPAAATPWATTVHFVAGSSHGGSLRLRPPLGWSDRTFGSASSAASCFTWILATPPPRPMPLKQVQYLLIEFLSFFYTTYCILISCKDHNL
eukprot:g59168.t1